MSKRGGVANWGDIVFYRLIQFVEFQRYLAERVVSLPMHPYLSEAEQIKICEIIKNG
jgi:hypothetical protein